MKINWVTEKVVMQPTTFCNINCSYCYLSGRDVAKRMLIEVADRVSDWLYTHDRPIEMVWHGGEPLATGIQHFSKLICALEGARLEKRVSHIIQTNGTLITPEWCELFNRFDFKVGVSIDGPASKNQNRVDWKGTETFDRVIEGIRNLNFSKIPFFALCVVTREALEQPEKLYQFFCKLGCTMVGFNLEEKLGPHQASASDDKDLVKGFWSRLFGVWKKNPIIQVREFLGALNWMNLELEDKKPSTLYDLFPTIGWNGDVVALAPELLGVSSERYTSFTVGNILDRPLGKILELATHSLYVKDYEQGVSDCRESCQYFDFCKGGVGSNKFFELGHTGGTETVYCRNREQRLLDSVLESL